MGFLVPALHFRPKKAHFETPVSWVVRSQETFMSLQDFGVLAEIIASVAVVISLIYLALQIKQSTAQSTAAASSGVLNEFNRMQEVMLANPLIPELFGKLEDNDGLNRTEEALLEAIARRYLVHWMEIQISHDRDLVDEVVYVSFCEDVERIIRRYPRLHSEFRKILKDYSVGGTVDIMRPIMSSEPNA